MTLQVQCTWHVTYYDIIIKMVQQTPLRPQSAMADLHILRLKPSSRYDIKPRMRRVVCQNRNTFCLDALELLDATHGIAPYCEPGFRPV